jgi:hypothetical protein
MSEQPSSKIQLNDPKAERQWATSGTGEEFECVHLSYAWELWAEIERLRETIEVNVESWKECGEENRRLRAALEKIAKWYPSKMSPAGDLAREILRPADETSAATPGSGE